MSPPDHPLAPGNLPPPIRPMRRRKRYNPFAWLAWLLILAALCMALWWAYVNGHLDRLQALLQTGSLGSNQEAAASVDETSDAAPAMSDVASSADSESAPAATASTQPTPDASASTESAPATTQTPIVTPMIEAPGAKPLPPPTAPAVQPMSPPQMSPPQNVAASSAPTSAVIPAASAPLSPSTRTTDAAASASKVERASPPPRAARADEPSRPTSRQSAASTYRDVQILSRVAPVYPASAMKSRVGGTTVLRVAVSRYGVPTSSQIVARSGSVDFDRAAMAAVAKWRFRPALRNGQTVESSIDVPIQFTPGRK